MRLLLSILGAWALAVGGPAEAQVTIGIVAPQASLKDFELPFSRGVASAGAQAKIEARGWNDPKDIITLANALGTAPIVAIAGPREVVEEAARSHKATAFFHLSVREVDRLPSSDAPPNLLGFASLPPEQRELLGRVLSSEPSIAIGPPSAARFLNGTKAREVQIEDQVPKALQRLLGSLAPDKPSVVGGVLPSDAAAAAFSAALSQRPIVSYFLFSPPPAQTRAHVAGRMIGTGLQRGAKTGDALIDWIRGSGRDSKELRELSLPWSMTYFAVPQYEGLAREAESVFRKGIQSADNTEECLCRDKSGRKGKPKLCERDKCRVERDYSDECSNVCATN